MAFLGTVLNTVGALFLTHAYAIHLAKQTRNYY